jgi:hypothetical protein
LARISGGDKLAEALREFSRKASRAAKVDVGFMENATYPDGTSVPLVAAINEFGAPSRGQPPRPYFRRMIKKCSPAWPAMIADFLRQTKYDSKRTLELTGKVIEVQLQQSIEELVSPPLAPSTIARKGFEKPLIETSHMINSVTSRVE